MQEPQETPEIFELDLSDLDIETISAVLANRVKLSSLKLRHNNLDPETMTILAPQLARLTQLSSLDLSWNKLNAKAIAILAQQLARLTQLRSLGLEYNGLDAAAMAMLAPQLMLLTQLNSLNLSRNKLDAAAMTILAPQLARLSHLTSLDLCYNKLDAAAMTILAQQLARLSQLRILNLSGNKLDAKAMTILASQLARLTQLRSLNLSYSCLNAEAIASLAKQLALLTQLYSLDLSNNNLDAEAMASVAPQLALLTQLRSLDLSGNKLDAAAMTILAPQLARLTQLRSLNLGYNYSGLKTEGIASLAPELALLTQLCSLDLSHNKLDAAAMTILAPQLARLTQLRSLDLSHNNLDSAAMTILVPQLARLTQLRSLNLGDNKLNAATRAIVEPILRRNEKIALVKDTINSAIDAFNPFNDDAQSSIYIITKYLDTLYAIAEEIEQQNQVQPTFLYDDYYNLTCRLALVLNDFPSAINAACAMNSVPVDTLVPYCTIEHPRIFVLVTRILAQQTQDRLAMEKLLELFIRLPTEGLISEYERFDLLVQLAKCADPDNNNENVQRLINLTAKHTPTGEVLKQAPDSQPTLTKQMLTTQLDNLIDSYEKLCFLQAIERVNQPRNDNEAQRFFQSTINPALVSLQQHFRDPQKQLQVGITQLLSVLNCDDYIHDQLGRALLKSVAKLLEIEDQVKVGDLHDNVCKELTTRYLITDPVSRIEAKNLSIHNSKTN